MIKQAFIRKLPNGKYRVVSKKGRNLGTYDTKDEATKRLQQVEFFKRQSEYDWLLKKTSEDEHTKETTTLTYSAVLRAIRKDKNEELLSDFQQAFHQNFLEAKKQQVDDAESWALLETFRQFPGIREKAKEHAS